MPRDAAARAASNGFKVWTQSMGIVSTFKHLHERVQRFTYENGSTKSALDDIYITSQNSHQIRESGIWLYSLNKGDHVGTSFVSIALNRIQRCRRTLWNVKTIKAINLKDTSKDMMSMFTVIMEDNLVSGKMALIDPIDDGECDPNIVQQWLDAAIRNLYDCLYKTAKAIWGEKSQTQQSIDRAISIK
ncbi:hypothetical protein PHMEG_00012562 [Phytophthora megakarya]|uniref:Uncharacterized protein n=1 Tax=Phytophthora megakarya TaxID=4795 RepID=A0A225W8F2_9STRA|nr:hypothetical protein PHMEG_00012562 [Phytophthora megakarya]